MALHIAHRADGLVRPTARGRNLQVAPKQGVRWTRSSLRARASNFDDWAKILPKWTSSHKPLGTTTSELHKTLGTAIKSVAVGFKPAKPEVPQLNTNAPLHKQLETVATFQLKDHLAVAQHNGFVPFNRSFFTSDVGAALQIGGATQAGRKGGSKVAVLTFVATETEREASWSRLEGLVLHWGVAQASDDPSWQLAPRGWQAYPDRTVDAGGAWQSGFEKQRLGDEGNQVMYSLLLKVPLEGPLTTGGLIFVLKALGGAGQQTKWLKDSETGKEFFINLQELPQI